MANIYGINGVNTTDESAQMVTAPAEGNTEEKHWKDALQLSKFAPFQAGYIIFGSNSEKSTVPDFRKITS